MFLAQKSTAPNPAAPLLPHENLCKRTKWQLQMSCTLPESLEGVALIRRERHARKRQKCLFSHMPHSPTHLSCAFSKRLQTPAACFHRWSLHSCAFCNDFVGRVRRCGALSVPNSRFADTILDTYRDASRLAFQISVCILLTRVDACFSCAMQEQAPTMLASVRRARRKCVHG